MDETKRLLDDTEKFVDELAKEVDGSTPGKLLPEEINAITFVALQRCGYDPLFDGQAASLACLVALATKRHLEKGEK